MRSEESDEKFSLRTAPHYLYAWNGLSVDELIFLLLFETMISQALLRLRRDFMSVRKQGINIHAPLRRFRKI